MFATTLGRITLVTVLLCTLCFGVLTLAVWSVDRSLTYWPTLHTGVPDITPVSARAVRVFDLETGKQIATKNEDEVLPIASVTKLLTASIFYDIALLDATTTITWQDVNTEGAAGKLHAAEIYTNRGLMYPLLLESSNDAATAMLRASPQLLLKMNAYTDALGLASTTFADPSGLSAQNVSTAYELSVLLAQLHEKEPHIFDITRLSQYIGKETGWLNNNPFVLFEGYRGGKHGFTYEANRTAAVLFDERLASGHTRTIGYVLLGSGDLLQDMALLRAEVQENVRYE